jgi:hypothetical protein
MNVEIGAEAAQFPEKEYINGIAVAVQCKMRNKMAVIGFGTLLIDVCLFLFNFAVVFYSTYFSPLSSAKLVGDFFTYGRRYAANRSILLIL